MDINRQDHAEAKLIADALFEVRLLLAPYLGSENEAPMNVRIAAHIAYALHNQASAMATGMGFDVAKALENIVGIDKILPNEEGSRLASLWKQAG